MQAEVGHAGLRLRRLEGRWNPLEAASSPPGQADGAKTLAEVLEAYHKERHFSAQRLEEMRTLVRRVGEVCGAGLPVAAFGPAHMLGCKQARMAMPWRMTAAERALPLPELVRRYEGQDVERVSLVTVQKDLGLLAPLFDWAVRHKLLGANPVAGVKLSKSVLKQSRRGEFEPHQLARLFASPVYAGCLSAARRWEPGSLVLRDELFWLPLLGLYTGARLEELGQLTPGDVGEIGGIPRIRIDTINDHLEAEPISTPQAGATSIPRRRRVDKQEGGKAVKTEASRRSVPIHPVLIELGFLEHVAERRAAGHAHVFPGLKPNRNGKRTQAFSKRFARHLDRVGLGDPSLVFHSFRHSFKTATRGAGLPEDMHDALTGHSRGGVGRDYGSYPLAELDRVLRRVRFPEVERILLPEDGLARLASGVGREVPHWLLEGPRDGPAPAHPSAAPGLPPAT